MLGSPANQVKAHMMNFKSRAGSNRGPKMSKKFKALRRETLTDFLARGGNVQKLPFVAGNDDDFRLLIQTPMVNVVNVNPWSIPFISDARRSFPLPTIDDQ